MLSRLSGGSLLLLGAVAIAGMGLIAFASGQSWPTALGGGGSTPQQLIGLERPGAGVHQGVAANHALRALGGPVGRVSGAPAVAGGIGPSTGGRSGTAAARGGANQFAGGTKAGQPPAVTQPGGGTPDNHGPSHSSGGSTPAPAPAPTPAPSSNGNGNGNAYGHSKGGDAQPAPTSPSTDSGSSDSSGNTAPSSPGNGHAYGHSKTPPGNAYGHYKHTSSSSSGSSSSGTSSPGNGHAYGHDKHGKD